MAKLQISTSLNSYKETKVDHPGSITPTTLAEPKKFFDISFDTESDKDTAGGGTISISGEDLSSVVYLETYRFGTVDGKTNNEVVHYGIRSNSLETKGDPLISTQIEVLREKITVFKKDSGSGKAKSTGGGGGSDFSQTQVKADAVVIHHSLEKDLLRKAIEHLLNTKDHKTVLVDIFAREKGAVKFEQEKGSSKQIIEVHTVVLYKQTSTVKGKYDVIVIDPSNSTFSSHISNENMSKDLGVKALNKIITPTKTIQIYTPVKDKTGDKSDQYRDCVDVAVKLALGFNKTQDALEVNKLKDHHVVKSISNSDKIDKSFFASDSVFRIKQTSSTKVVDKVAKLEELIDRSTKTVSAFDKNTHQSIVSKRKELIKKEDESYKYSDPSTERLVEFEKEIMKVLGEVMNSQLEAITVEEES